MSARQPTLFEGARASMHDSIADALGALLTYGPRHRRWALGWSWGKDSTAAVTFVVHAIEAGLVSAPESLTVLSADTRVELPPLAITAQTIREELLEHTEALASVVRRVEHPGCLKYALAFGRACRRALPRSLPYLRLAPTPCSEVLACCA